MEYSLLKKKHFMSFSLAWSTLADEHNTLPKLIDQKTRKIGKIFI